MQVDAIAVDPITVAGKLCAQNANRARRAVHGHGACGALEDDKARIGLVRPIERAVHFRPAFTIGAPGPRAPVNHAVVIQRRIAAIPGAQCGTQGRYHVDLSFCLGLNMQLTGGNSRRACRDQQTLVRQPTAIVKQAIDSATKAADITDVQIAVQHQIPADTKQHRAARGAEGRIDIACAVKAEIACHR